jgi:predicted SnoaL-like aldol condensation-catalyzing enzyme
MSATSNTELNKIIARYWLEFINTGNIEAVCRITAPEWKMHGGFPGLPQGPEGVRKLFSSFGQIKQQWKPDEIIAEGDKVVVRAINNCLQESFLGVPAFGRKQIFSATFIHRIVNGKIEETWRNADDLGRVIQLGARIVPSRATSNFFRRQPINGYSQHEMRYDLPAVHFN